VGLAASVPASAGLKSPGSSITLLDKADGTGFAWGTINAVRQSANNVERLRCSLSVGASDTTMVTCVATNAAGTTRMCVSAQPNHALAALGVGDGYLYFSWDAQGNCAIVQGGADSAYAPKTP
jgi:hypothetical protein